MLDDVRPLIEVGFAVHLLRPKSKIPVEGEWSSAPIGTFHSIKRKYRDGQNVGVRLGKPSRVEGMYLYVIDMDVRRPREAKAAEAALKKLLPDVRLHRLPCVQSGSGKDSFHYYFLSEDLFPSKKLAHSGVKFTDDDGKDHWTWEIELFGTGKQVALPPSIHPDTGNRYHWITEPDLEIGIPSIPAEVIGDLVYRSEETDRDPESLEPLDLTDDEIWDVLDDIAGDADDHESWRNVGMALKHELGDAGWPIFDAWSKRGRGYDKRGNAAQWRAFKNKRANPITMRSLLVRSKEVRIREEFSEIDREPEPQAIDEAGDEVEVRKGDPDMTVLRQSRISPPPFPIDIFGSKWGAKIARLAASVGAPTDFVAAGLLAGAATAIGNAVRVEIRPGFTQPAILWCQVIGLPSANKSPALRPITEALTALERRYEPMYQAAYRRWEREKAVAEIRLKEYEAKVKAIVAKGEEVEGREPDGCRVPPEPNRRQSILNDVTIEAFMRAQARNPRGFMVFRDELYGWLGNMDRYSNSAERGAWLESYDGGPYAVERVKDGNKTLRVARMCSPIVGGIQPERLIEITGDNAADDGLQARFMPFWPEEAFRPMSDTTEPSGWILDAFEALSELRMDVDEHGAGEPTLMPFTREAFAAFRQWSDNRKWKEQHELVRLAGVFGKAEGLVGRIALNLELLWWALENDFEDADPPKTVSLRAVSAAIAFRQNYLKPMQERVFAHSVEPEEMLNARKIAKWIVKNEAETLNLRELRREAGIKGLSNRTSSDVIEDAVAVLIGLRWLTEDDGKERGRGRGRPSKTYSINPRVYELLPKRK